MNSLEKRIRDMEQAVTEAEQAVLVMVSITDCSAEGSEGVKPGFAIVSPRIGRPARTVYPGPGESLKDFENRMSKQVNKQELTT